MKINSNTVKLERNEYKELAGVIRKIAAVNGFNDIESVEVHVDPHESTIKFKTAEKGGLEVITQILRGADFSFLNKDELVGWLDPILKAYAGGMSIEDFIYAGNRYLEEGSSDMEIIDQVRAIYNSVGEGFPEDAQEKIAYNTKK